MTALRSRRPTSDVRDAGFTLPELLIAIVVTGIMLPVIAVAVAVTLKTVPSASARADAGVAAQGITSWLPADVDSTEPGGFDADPGTPSGCLGPDPGTNVLRLSWKETFRGVTVRYVAAYRLVPRGESAHIVRISCSGSPDLGPAARLSLSGPLAPTAPTVTLLDGNLDGMTDRVRLSVQTLTGTKIFLDAVSKNPNESLPVPPPADSTTTLANRSPVAQPVALTANPAVPVTIVLPVSDPDGDALTAAVSGLPVGWTAVTSGTTVTLTPALPAATSTFDYTVTDPSGAAGASTISVTVVIGSTTTSSTSTTTPPPCVLSAVSVSPSSVGLTANGIGRLKRNVRVTITIDSGYCVGLTLNYETGAPNGQYIQNFGDSKPYVVTLQGHPHGTELWAAGPHDLEVRDGTGTVLATRVLTVTN